MSATLQQSGETVSEKTFMKWDKSLTVDFQITKVDAKGMIRGLKCKICTKYQSQIKSKSQTQRISGTAAIKFAENTFMDFGNVKRCYILQ